MKTLYLFLCSIFIYTSVAMSMESSAEKKPVELKMLGIKRRPKGSKDRRLPSLRAPCAHAGIVKMNQDPSYLKDFATHCKRYLTLKTASSKFGRHIGAIVGMCAFALGTLYAWTKLKPARTVQHASKVLSMAVGVRFVTGLIKRFTARF